MPKKVQLPPPGSLFTLGGTKSQKSPAILSKSLNQNSVENIDANSKLLSENRIEQLLTISELAASLQCSKSYIKKLRAKGVITPAISMHRFVRYKLSDVLVALQKRSLL